MNQSPDVLTVLTGLATPNLTSIPPSVSTSLLSLAIAKLPEMTWSRSTIDLEMMLDHSECGNGGARDELTSDDFVSLRSQAKILSNLSLLSRLSPSLPSDTCSLMVHGKSFSSCFCLFGDSSVVP